MADTSTTFDPADWRHDAACRDLDTAIFFPDSEDASESAAAKAVCSGCPVRAACLEFALSTRQDDGVWGGLTEVERRRLRRRRQEAGRRTAA
jgi:WhiB family redox-sensing transcriptional regulator